MASDSKTYKSLLNARVNIIYFLLALSISFFSRKIFLEYLGDEFIGLTATLNSILSFLNITELGVISAVYYMLYKPLQEDNRIEINKIISILGYIYKRIGWIIFSLAVIVSLFFPIIFNESEISLPVVYFGFYSFLASSLFSYFINYPTALFMADQRGYEIVRYSQLALILKTILGMFVAKFTGDFYLYISLDIVLGLATALIIQWRIKVVYPWLKVAVKRGNVYLKEYPVILTKTKQIFFHKIGGFAQKEMAPVLIFAFSSLSTVAFYTNYTLITQKLSQLVNSALGSTFASIGILIAEGDAKKTFSVYKEMLALRFMVAGYLVFMLFVLLESFIKIWLGEEYILDPLVLVFLLIIVYIEFIRSATEQFLAGYGLFQDIWAPFTEAFICVVVSVSGGYFYGLPGVLLGNIVSLLIIVCIWKPYFLFKNGLNINVAHYWVLIFKHLFIYSLVFLFVYYIFQEFLFLQINDYLHFVIVGGYLSFVFVFVYFSILYFCDNGTRDVLHRIFLLFKGKFLK